MSTASKNKPRVAVQKTAEGKFSVAAAFWGLELMSVHTYSSPESNRDTCVSFFPSRKFLLLVPNRSLGDNEELICRAVSGKMAGFGASQQVQLVNVLICLFFYLFIFRGECVPFLLCLLLSDRFQVGKLNSVGWAVSTELLNGGNKAGALLTNFAEESVYMKAVCSFIPTPLDLWQQKYSPVFIHNNSLKLPALDSTSTQRLVTHRFQQHPHFLEKKNIDLNLLHKTWTGSTISVFWSIFSHRA